MANLNIRKIPKGIKIIPYPKEDIIQEFTSKDYTGTLSLINETGKFKFDPALEVGSAEGITYEYTQANHGFDLLSTIYYDGGQFALASAGNVDTAGLWVVVDVAGPDTFTLGQVGRFDVGMHGLALGQYYFVGLNPGSLVPTQPPAVSNPLVFVESTTVIHVLPFRPSNEGGDPGEIGLSTTDDLPEGLYNLYYTDLRVQNNPAVVANTAKVSFPEAPIDSVEYARKNESWVPLPDISTIGDMQKSIYDPTNIEGNAFSRELHTGFQEASTISDFDTEVENNPDVVANTAKISFPEAPIDNRRFVRVNASWKEIDAALGGIPEAPIDGVMYGRQDVDWLPVQGLIDANLGGFEFFNGVMSYAGDDVIEAGIGGLSLTIGGGYTFTEIQASDGISLNCPVVTLPALDVDAGAANSAVTKEWVEGKAADATGFVTEIKTASFTAEHARIYVCDTTAGDITVLLPDADGTKLQCNIIKESSIDTGDILVTTVSGTQPIADSTIQFIYGEDESLMLSQVASSGYTILSDSRNRLVNALSRSTGIISGFEITVNPDNTINVGEGIYAIEDSDPMDAPSTIIRRFPGENNYVISGLNTSGITYLFIDASGTINTLQSVKVPPTYWRINPRFGYIVHLGGTGVVESHGSYLTPAQNPGARLSNYMDFFGVIKEDIVLAGYPGTLQMIHTAGEIMSPGLNTDVLPNSPDNLIIPEANPIPQFHVFTRSAYHGFNSALDVTMYNPTGDTISPIGGGPNSCTINRVYLSIGGGISIQYGQNSYIGRGEAIEAFFEGSDSFQENSVFTGITVLIGLVIAEKTATDLSNPSDVTFIPTSRTGEAVSGSAIANLVDLQDAYNNSVQPQITTDALNLALQVKGGSGLDTDYQFELLNNTGTSKYRFTGLELTKDGDYLTPYTEWKGNWVNSTYYKNQMVKDGDWTMIANKQTIERPAPQPAGPPEYDLPDVPLWTELDYLGVVWSGTEYVLTQSGWVKELQVWVPELTSSTNYRIRTYNNTDPANPIINVIEEPVLKENDWTTVAVDAVPYAAGSVIGAVLDALNSGADTTITGGWTRAINNNTITVDPTLAHWGTSNSANNIRINKTDLDSVGRETELLSIGAGSIVTLVDTADSTKSMSWRINADPVDYTTHIGYGDVTYSGSGPGGEPAIGADCIMTATIPVVDSTNYVTVANYWPTNQPDWATVKGVLRLGGVDQPADDNAYGIRILFEPAYVSPDWDLVALSGGGGGAGSEGGTVFADTDFRVYDFDDNTKLMSFDVGNITTATTTTITVPDTSGNLLLSEGDNTINGNWNFTAPVGIGVSSPSEALDVNGNINSNGTIEGVTVKGLDIQAFNIVSATGGNSTNWNEAFSWGDHALAGYLKAGDIEFNPSLTIDSTGDFGSQLIMQRNALDKWTFDSGNINNNDSLSINSVTTSDIMTFKPTGEVGINEANPQAMFHVAGNSTFGNYNNTLYGDHNFFRDVDQAPGSPTTTLYIGNDLAPVPIDAAYTYYNMVTYGESDAGGHGNTYLGITNSETFTGQADFSIYAQTLHLASNPSNKRQIILSGIPASYGASQINSKLQVGFDQWSPRHDAEALEVNGNVISGYSEVINNTPYTATNILKHKVSTETATDRFYDETKPSHGILFDREWTDGREGPLGGIYMYGQVGWRAGMFFRVKGANSQTADADITALDMNHLGDAKFYSKVGIGTAPTEALDVNGNILVNQTDDKKGLILKSSTIAPSINFVDGTNGSNQFIQQFARSSIELRTYYDTTIVSTMTSSGHLALGKTTSPTQALDVNGNGRFYTGVSIPTSEYVMIGGNGVIGNRAAVYFQNAASSGSIRMGIGGNTNTNNKLVIDSTGVAINKGAILATEALDVDGKIILTGNLMRASHNTGHLEGSYNNIANNASATNPIYTIGSSYNPDVNTLSNMFGIGYSYAPSCSYLTELRSTGDGWGLYIASEGIAKVFLDGTNGNIVAKGEATAQKFISTTSSDNSVPVSGSSKTDGYGLIGNRGSVYLTNNGGDIRFCTEGGAHGSGIRMRVGSSGVAIGGSNVAPTEALDVSGRVTCTDTLYVDGFDQGSLNYASTELMAASSRSGGVILYAGNDNDLTVVPAGNAATVHAKSTMYEVIPPNILAGEYTRPFVELWHGDNGSGNGGAQFVASTSSTYSGNGDMVAMMHMTDSSAYSWKRNVILTNGSAVRGHVSQINSRLQVGYDQWSPNFTKPETLSVNGDIVATGDITAFSDRRLKTDLQIVENSLEKVSKLNGYTYTKDENRSAGLVAQEVREVLPEAVKGEETDDKFLSLNDAAVTALLVEAIKELEARVKQLENQLK